jgi:lysophospholipase L1-like esterase
MGFRRAVAVITAFLSLTTGVIGAGSAAAAGPPQRGYYLSLGDSIAFGFRPDLATIGDVNPAHYRGYAEGFAAMRPHLTLVNYACPGETSTTMLMGGCTWPTSHDPYPVSDSQLAAAEAFLGAHPGQVSLISIDIGSNDLLGVVRPCADKPDPIACIRPALGAALTTLAGNYAQILKRLTDVAPTAKIVVLNYYNPLELALPGSDELATRANQLLQSLADDVGASVADAFGAINHRANSPAELVFLCTRTWECTKYKDVHPTPLGYRALTVALLHASR